MHRFWSVRISYTHGKLIWSVLGEKFDFWRLLHLINISSGMFYFFICMLVSWQTHLTSYFLENCNAPTLPAYGSLSVTALISLVTLTFDLWSLNRFTGYPHDGRDVLKLNFGSVSVFKTPNRSEAKRSNPKFRFPWLFSKQNLLVSYK